MRRVAVGFSRGRRVLVECLGPWVAKEVEPISYMVSREGLEGGGTLVASPASPMEVVVGAEEFEEPLGDAFMNVEVGAKCRIEALDGAACSMALLEQEAHRLQDFEGALPGQVSKQSAGTE